MRVLFVSDTHLGFDLPSRPRVVRRRRGDDFFLNFERALDAARTREIDVVVHGGDLLYRSRVPAWLADAALAPLRRLASAGVPVLLVPGNHERARLPYPLLALHEGLHVFDRPRTVTLEARGVRVAFSGFPYTPAIRRRFPEMFAAATRDVHDVPAALDARESEPRHLPAAAAPGADAVVADVRVLCIHQAVEGATCGPGHFTFRFGDDVIRTADLPPELAVTLSGHIHRHQVLRPARRSPVVYAGSVERTSFAEASEPKGFVVLDLTRSGLERFEFRTLPARPMVARTVSFSGAGARDVESRVAAVIQSTPPDAVVQVRVAGAIPPSLTAGLLRSLAGARNVTLAVRTPEARREGSR
jgi:DNA repair exonuclease SbcCD nuclease subunit